MEDAGSVLVVDDDPFVLDSCVLVLEHGGYNVIPCNGPGDAMRTFREAPVDTALLDIDMPRISGLELLDEMLALRGDVPVMLMTGGDNDSELVMEAIRKGAFDFIKKPFHPGHLIIAVEKALRHSVALRHEKCLRGELERVLKLKTEALTGTMDAIRDSSRDMVERLARMAEYRDTDTAGHNSRISMYSRSIAEALGLPREFVETVAFASPMHDIGKIGIPDAILLKEGPLDEREFEEMKKHTRIGHDMLAGSSHHNIQMAATIALTHHERWDGTGYPGGLRGGEIPLEGMIVQIGDSYDALRNRRPYKRVFSHEQAYRVIVEGNDKTIPGHFHPEVLSAFRKCAGELEEIFETHNDLGDRTAGGRGDCCR